MTVSTRAKTFKEWAVMMATHEFVFVDDSVALCACASLLGIDIQVVQSDPDLSCSAYHQTVSPVNSDASLPAGAAAGAVLPRPSIVVGNHTLKHFVSTLPLQPGSEPGVSTGTASRLRGTAGAGRLSTNSIHSKSASGRSRLGAVSPLANSAATPSPTQRSTRARSPAPEAPPSRSASIASESECEVTVRVESESVLDDSVLSEQAPTDSECTASSGSTSSSFCSSVSERTALLSEFGLSPDEWCLVRPWPP